VTPALLPNEPKPGVAPAAGQSEPTPGGPARASGSIVLEDELAPAEVPPAPAGDEKLAIGEAIRQQSADVEACYSKSLERNPLLMGKLIAQFDIGPRGKVIGATADGIADRDLLLCVVQVVRKWEFAQPASGGKVRVRYPWRLEPRASALPASAPLGSAK
jgi:hypothetical protein